MDLFTGLNLQKNRGSVADSVGENWARQLPPDTVNLVPEIISKVYLDYVHDNCYPPFDRVFKAFAMTNFEDVRVVILGQDPYYNGNATGLAFGCGRELSPSLKQIANAIMDNFPDEYVERVPKHPSGGMGLEYLAQQGVLLLNTALTVKEGQPGSHSVVWKPFTEGIINALQKRLGIVWLLWGKHAQNFEPLITNNSHVVLKCSHPASAAYNKEPWICDHFSRVNHLLSTPIIWF